MTKLKTRNNSSGYRQFYDREEGRWVSTHRRVMAKRLGEDAIQGKHVHHIDHDKRNNRPGNLVALAPHVHSRIHKGDPDACFRCGRSGHWASDCYARHDFQGGRIDD